jgi:hypothetical protein
MGIDRDFAEVKQVVREKMRQTGLEAKIGVNHFHRSIDEGVGAFCKRQQGKLE